MKLSVGLTFFICGITIIHLNDIAESTILTNDHDIGKYVSRLIKRFRNLFDFCLFILMLRIK